MMLVPRRNFDVFDDFFNDSFFSNHESKMMNTDIKEHDDRFELLIDLPGFEREDIKMHIEDGYLVINAKSSFSDVDEEEGRYVRKERFYGECSRRFYVGEDVKEEDIKANFRNGTLNITIPKIDESRKTSEKKYIEIGE